MQKSARLRVSEPRTDVRSRISAYRLVAYSSVVYCVSSLIFLQLSFVGAREGVEVRYRTFCTYSLCYVPKQDKNRLLQLINFSCSPFYPCVSRCPCSHASSISSSTQCTMSSRSARSADFNSFTGDIYATQLGPQGGNPWMKHIRYSCSLFFTRNCATGPESSGH